MEHGAGRCPHGASSAWRNIRPRIRSDGITPLALRENPFGTGPTRFASGFTDQASSGWRVSWRGRPPSGMEDGTSTKSGVARNLPKTRPDSSSRVGFGHAVRRSGAPGGLARSVPSTLFHSSTGTASVQPAPDQRRPAAAGWITGPSQIDGTCETWALCADRSVIPSAPATAGRSGSAGGSCSPGTDLESPAESRIHYPENSAPPLQDMPLHHPCLRTDHRLDDHCRRFGLLVGSQSPEGGE